MKKQKQETDIIQIVGRHMAAACPVGREPEFLAGLVRFFGPKQDAKAFLKNSIKKGFEDRMKKI